MSNLTAKEKREIVLRFMEAHKKGAFYRHLMDNERFDKTYEKLATGGYGEVTRKDKMAYITYTVMIDETESKSGQEFPFSWEEPYEVKPESSDEVANKNSTDSEKAKTANRFIETHKDWGPREIPYFRYHEKIYKKLSAGDYGAVTRTKYEGEDYQHCTVSIDKSRSVYEVVTEFHWIEPSPEPEAVYEEGTHSWDEPHDFSRLDMNYTNRTGSRILYAWHDIDAPEWSGQYRVETRTKNENKVRTFKTKTELMSHVLTFVSG